ncbi:hypothetical protein ACIBH1_46035 [Nonomuraea sp. NPDC050663]|uniref:Putative membrane protein n=1 Tax=Nonomuraea soli TaxID=1032476 RepID=A0A7W0CIH8_9ACTN|nr:hypothetical protein [Nonomuraea soli]MBA2891674.1 putative membrane protein [Nonomuraea soli]NUT44234.1 hypothetical protein [Thermoactinospora sp.]
MGRMVMLVVGTLLAIFVLFNFIVPMVLGLLKIALIIGVIGVVFFLVIRVFSGSSSSYR